MALTNMPPLARLGVLGCCVALWAPGMAAGQEFSRFLQCKGSVDAQGRQLPAQLDMALRFNDRTALIQRSDVLPVGQRLRYTPSAAAYSMVYRLRPQGTQVWVVPGWLQNTVLVKLPNLQRIHQIRLAIDRQTGELDGAVLNEEDQPLAVFRMSCLSTAPEDMAPPRF